jgi:hypothetical protein
MCSCCLVRIILYTMSNPEQLASTLAVLVETNKALTAQVLQLTEQVASLSEQLTEQVASLRGQIALGNVAVHPDLCTQMADLSADPVDLHAHLGVECKQESANKKEEGSSEKGRPFHGVAYGAGGQCVVVTEKADYDELMEGVNHSWCISFTTLKRANSFVNRFREITCLLGHEPNHLIGEKTYTVTNSLLGTVFFTEDTKTHDECKSLSPSYTDGKAHKHLAAARAYAIVWLQKQLIKSLLTGGQSYTKDGIAVPPPTAFKEADVDTNGVPVEPTIATVETILQTTNPKQWNSTTVSDWLTTGDRQDESRDRRNSSCLR